ncbi:MAG: MFS transporter, partial [Cyanobacteria bacterium J06642_11]
MGWTVKNKTANKMMALTTILLAIELFDELVGGVLEPAWPLIRDDLNLSYGQVGILLAVPNIASQLVEPLFGVWADMGHGRRLMLAGAWGFGIALLILACSHTFMGVLIGFMVLTPAAGALVNVAMATLMDPAHSLRIPPSSKAPSFCHGGSGSG